MKEETHPDYKAVVFEDVSIDYKVLTRSTMTSEATIEWEDGNTYPLIRVEISSASHPFYTGKRQLIADRGGRIEQFRRRYNIPDEDQPAPSADGGETAQDEQAASEETTDS